MTAEELNQKLLMFEDYEKDNYQRWQDFQSLNNWEEASAEEQEALWSVYQKQAEEYLQAYMEIGLKNQIPILDYQATSGNIGKPGISFLTDMASEQFVLSSRDLIAGKQGIEKWMMIQKHGRLGACFVHRHSFLEMNYCYSGIVPNLLYEKKIEMEPGDLLLMEPGCAHNIGVLREQDVLMNLVWFPSAMLTVLEKIMPGECELSRFLLGAMSHTVGKMNYLFLKTSQEPKIREEINELMTEYYAPGRVASEALFDQLIRTIFTRLWRFSEERPELTIYNYRPGSKVSRMIAYIREHCVDCTRESVAEHFGYSGSRVSNLLTEHLGVSFVKLRNEFRLERIEELLQSTNLPVQTIAEQNGFFNQSHFYRTYKEHFGYLPRENIKKEAKK